MWMQEKAEFLPKKCVDILNILLKDAVVGIEDYKVIAISQIIFRFEDMLHEMIEFIEIHIGKKLACHIAEWQSDPRSCLEAPKNHLDERQDVRIADLSFDDFEEDLVIYVIEEFPHVAFQRKRRSRMITADLPDVSVELLHSSMGAFTFPARIRISDEFSVENLIQYSEQGLIENAITDASLVDVTQFRIADIERYVRIWFPDSLF